MPQFWVEFCVERRPRTQGRSCALCSLQSDCSCPVARGKPPQSLSSLLSLKVRSSLVTLQNFESLSFYNFNNDLVRNDCFFNRFLKNIPFSRKIFRINLICMLQVKPFNWEPTSTRSVRRNFPLPNSLRRLFPTWSSRMATSRTESRNWRLLCKSIKSWFCTFNTDL